ncbi:uncharacterized protein PAC_13301 [Phialocephala subalpina]|uniref:Uncharacterized protein n=1 Tax=Phialocephala subalpina TaxID=576137 RepID=A0A1L7XEF5_9HELO|nr:uncharacterized protein PAC_13301 [Phialocephala subalpina]
MNTQPPWGLPSFSGHGHYQSMQPRGDNFDHSGFVDNRITFDGPEDRTPGRTLDGHNGFGGYSAYQTIGFNSFNQTNTGQASGVVTTHREGFIRETSFVRFGSEDPQAKREHNGEAQLKQEEISGDEADDLLFRIRDEKDFLTQKNKRIKTQRDRKEKLKIDELEAIDFPSTNHELRIHVKRLVDAIKNTDNILDKPCKNGKPAQAAQRLDRGYYPDEDVELLAWEILFGLRDAQLGVILVDEYHGFKYESYDSFKSRFEATLQALKESKAVCKQLLDPSFVHRLCDAPDSELRQKENNKKVNGERDTQNEIGRNILSGKLDPKDAAKLKREEEVTPGRRRARARVERSTPKGKIATTTPKKGTPGSNHNVGPYRSGSKRNTSGKIKKEEFSDEEEEEDIDEYSPPAPRSSSKRKAGMVNYADDVDSEDSGDDSYDPIRDTPTKKPRTLGGRSTGGRAPSGGRAPGRISKISQGPPPRLSFGSPETVKSPTRARVPSQTGPFEGPSSSTNAATSGGPSTLAHELSLEAQKEHQLRYALNNRYRDIICELLQVNPADAREYTLDDLRRYARAYNQAFRGIPYHDPETPNFTYFGHKAFQDSRQMRLDHFAHVNARYAPLAITRGDLDARGVYNANAPRGAGFNTGGEEVEDQALGVINNDFGVPESLYPSVYDDEDGH